MEIKQITAPTLTKEAWLKARNFDIFYQFKVLKMWQRDIAKEHRLSVDRVKHIIAEQKLANGVKK